MEPKFHSSSSISISCKYVRSHNSTNRLDLPIGSSNRLSPGSLPPPFHESATNHRVSRLPEMHTCLPAFPLAGFVLDLDCALPFRDSLVCGQTLLSQTWPITLSKRGGTLSLVSVS